MEVVLLLLESCLVGEQVMSFGFLPQVVELDQLADGPGADLGNIEFDSKFEVKILNLK